MLISRKHVVGQSGDFVLNVMFLLTGRNGRRHWSVTSLLTRVAALQRNVARLRTGSDQHKPFLLIEGRIIERAPPSRDPANQRGV